MHHTDARIAGWNALELGAAILAAIWLLSAGSYLWGAHNATQAGAATAPGAFLVLIVLILPLALIGAMVLALRALRLLRAEIAQLQSSLASMQQEALQAMPLHSQCPPAPRGSMAQPPQAGEPSTQAAQPRVSQPPASQPSASRPPTSLPPASRPPASRPPASRPPASQTRDAVGAQSVLAFDTPPEPQHPPLAQVDFILALQFPEGPDDHEGFRALRVALEDRSTAKLIRAAQDALTLLAQEGIFVDELMPDTAAPEIWRRFAAGERGRGIAALGGIHEPAPLNVTAARMREDPVFRDAAHHFLRAFDRSFALFERAADDDEIDAFAATRTARAFMLFGRVAGIFD